MVKYHQLYCIYDLIFLVMKISLFLQLSYIQIREWHNGIVHPTHSGIVYLTHNGVVHLTQNQKVNDSNLTDALGRNLGPNVVAWLPVTSRSN